MMPEGQSNQSTLSEVIAWTMVLLSDIQIFDSLFFGTFPRYMHYSIFYLSDPRAPFKMQHHSLLSSAAESPPNLVRPSALDAQVVSPSPHESRVLLEHPASNSQIQVVVLKVPIGLLALCD